MTTTDETVGTLNHIYALLRRSANSTVLTASQGSQLLAAATVVHNITNQAIIAQRSAAEQTTDSPVTKRLIKSSTRKGVTHVVKIRNGEAEDCSCEDSTIRDNYCKHMRQVDNELANA